MRLEPWPGNLWPRLLRPKRVDPTLKSRWAQECHIQSAVLHLIVTSKQHGCSCHFFLPKAIMIWCCFLPQFRNNPKYRIYKIFQHTQSKSGSGVDLSQLHQLFHIQSQIARWNRKLSFYKDDQNTDRQWWG